MRLIRILAGLVMLIFVAGCFVVPSAHPFYREKDLVFDSALIGTWESTGLDSKGKANLIEQDFVMNFAKADEKEYTLLYQAKDEPPAKFTARLFELGKDTYLDLYPDTQQLADKESTFYMGHFWPMHSLVRLSRKGDKMLLAGLDPEWVAQQISRGGRSLGSVEKNKDGSAYPVLTADTQRLQQLILWHDNKAFTEGSVLQRKSATAGESGK